jgi:hypothetical protein
MIPQEDRRPKRSNTVNRELTQAEPRLHNTVALLSSTQNVGLGRSVTLLPDPQSLGGETGDRHVSELIMWEVRREERRSM